MILNYSDLQNSTGDFLNRQDLLPIVKTFIQFAEADFNRTLRVRDMISSAPVALAFTTSDLAALPDDFIELKGAPVGPDGKPLGYKTDEDLSVLDADPNLTGNPLFYTILGPNMRISPAPGPTATTTTYVTINYYQRIPALTDPTESNWLLQKHPDLYLYTTLMQSAPYLKDDERIQIWGGIQQKLMADISMDTERASYRGATPLITSKGGSIG